MILPPKYLSFIEECRQNTYNGNVHEHHILPRHAGGTNHKDNLIPLSLEDHITAHQILWEECGSFADFRSVVLLTRAKGVTKLQMSESSNQYWSQPGVREEQSVVHKEVANQPETKQRMREAAKKRWEDPEYRAKLLAKRRARPPASMKTRQKLANSTKKRWQSEDSREKMLQSMKDAASDPTISKRKTEMMKKRWEDPKFREKQTNILKDLHKNPKIQKAASERMKKLWQDKDFRSSQVEKITKGIHDAK
jgi:hypothetical protein